MSDALIVGIITAAVSLIGIFISAKNTRDRVTNELGANQQVMSNEITHIKENVAEMKDDLRAHNQYAKLFNENVPVLKQQISDLDRRISTLENDLKDDRK